MSKAGDICPKCGIHLLRLVKGRKPRNVNYLRCTYCKSKFSIDK